MDSILDLIKQILDKKKSRFGGRLRDRRAMALAVAKAMLRFGHRRCFDPELAAPYAPGVGFMTRRMLWMASGGFRMTVRLVRGGGCSLDDPVWTAGFLEGLKVSGALKRGRSFAEWVLWSPEARPGLTEALKGCPWHFEARHVPSGLLLRHFVAGDAPAEDPDGADVLAGFFAGCLTKRVGDETWLATQGSERVDRLLESWGIGTTRLGTLVLVSPFWGAVMSRRMPLSLASELRRIRRPACCPQLPVSLWMMAGLGGRGMRFVGGLPWGRGRWEAYRRSGGVKELRREAFERFGVSRIDPRMRDELLSVRDLAVKDPSSRFVLGRTFVA